MTVPALRTPRPVRRWAGLILLSAACHAALLGAFALRLPSGPRLVATTMLDVSIPAPPLVRLPTSTAAAPPVQTQARVLAVATAPRFVETAQAATGGASDVVDLFGPVFADGLWPRPMALGNVPCDPEAEPERAEACRRELMLIGLASDGPAGSKAQP